ncbi:MAG: MazF family transcriptional regulator [Gammaproteobacteria bacterium RIFCSPHIGHO2_12_FULL_42_13]|nr:MAG: MazF family transcriptional regulator [Gammaproteobacteria bacterium RIFCSPHIGHO2_12_FULL_42_13]
MVEKMTSLTQGGVYLEKLDPIKSGEIGKIRPVVLLTTSIILEVQPEIIFICPLSSQSYSELAALHVKLPPRDQLKKTSFALVEHCRSITIKRLHFPRIAQLTEEELSLIVLRLQRIIKI